MLKATRLSFVAALTAGAAASGHALLIDNFSTGPDTLSIATGTGTVLQSETGLTILGGQRDSTLVVSASPFMQQVSLGITGNAVMPGAFYSSGIGDMGNATFDYSGLHVDGTRGPGLNANVSGDGAFQIQVLASDTPITFTVTASTFGSGGSGDDVSVGTFTTTAPILSPTTFTLDFSSMTTAGGSTSGFNASDLDQFTVQASAGTAGGDFALGSFSTSPVPEPASMAALMVGLAGLYRMRRRRRP